MLTPGGPTGIIYARNEQESRRTIQEEDNAGGIREQVEYDYSGQLVIVAPRAMKSRWWSESSNPGAGRAGGGYQWRQPWIRGGLTQALQSVLDVPAYRITIQKVVRRENNAEDTHQQLA